MMKLKETQFKWALAALILVVVATVYRLTSAPTASFWDCAELIACSYILGIPHPPGTPLFVLLGRLFSFIPTAHEPAARIGFLTSFFGAVACVLVYLIIVKLCRRITKEGRPVSGVGAPGPIPAPRSPIPFLPYLAGVVGALSLAFAYSFWDNSVETEVYGPVTTVALLTILLALNWRDNKTERTSDERPGTRAPDSPPPTPHASPPARDNRVILASMFLILLSAGIHFTPMLTVFALLVFWLIVDRGSVLDLRFIEFFGGFLIILTMQSMIEAGAGPVAWVLVGLLLLALLALAIWVMESEGTTPATQHPTPDTHTRYAIWGLLILAAMLVIAYIAGYDARSGKDLIVDDLVLFLASPVTAIIERWLANRILFIVFLAGYAGYLVWLARRKRLDITYVALGLFLVLLAGTIQYVMLVRARLNPAINEVNPGHWDGLVSVLKREQYDPMNLYPRKTMFATETDYLANRNAHLGLLAGYFEQIKMYLRYFLWQWAGRNNLDVMAWSGNWFLHFNPIPALIGLIAPLLGIWGMIDRARKDRKGFALIGLAFLVSSLGLLTYLNLKLSPSDPRHLLFDPGRDQGMHFVEVRERDYFFAFSYIFYAIFIGAGACALFNWVRKKGSRGEKQEARPHSPRPALRLVVTLTLLVSFLPIFFNFREVTRAGDWIPTEYGYDMVASCDDGSVLFTNGDNDTFPLWFVQEVPTAIARYGNGFKKPVKPRKGVFVANLSLMNTDWNIRQMIEWGNPFSFDAAKFDSLPMERYYGAGERSFLLREMTIRDMIATNSNIQLRWGNEHQRYQDPQTGKTVTVAAFRDEYREARDEYASVMDAAIGETQNPQSAIQNPKSKIQNPPSPGLARRFLAGSRTYLKWLDDNRFSIAAIELRDRLPRYEALATADAGLDVIRQERVSFEKWLNRGDYGMPSYEFTHYVMPRYNERVPIYFATTVQDEYLLDLIKGDSLYARMEGLAQRVVSSPGLLSPRLRALDARKTEQLIDSVYQIRSMSDKTVMKDANTRGMYTNFIVAAVKLADDSFAQAHQYDKAEATVGWVNQLDLDVDRRLPLFEALGRYAYLKGDYAAALNWTDSLQRYIGDPDARKQIVLLRSFINQLKGDYPTALNLIGAVRNSGFPERGVLVLLDTMYATYAGFNGTGYPRQVLARWRQSSPRDSLPILIGQALDNLEKGK